MDVNEFISLNVPVEADHVAEVALPPMIPAKLIVVPEQMVISVPAVAVALALTVIGTDAVCAKQKPPALLKLKSIEKFPLLRNVTVYGPCPDPLTIAPKGQVHK